MPKQLLIAVAAGAASGLLLIAPLSGTMFGFGLANFAHLPLFVAGLSAGLFGAAVASATATALVALIMGLFGALPFLAAFAIPTIILVRQALLSRPGADGTAEWYPSGMLLTVLVSYGLAALAVVTLLLAGRPDGLTGVVEDMFADAIGMVTPGMPAGERQDMAAHMSTLPPSIVVASWVLTVTINGVLAQALVARSGTNLRPTPRYNLLQAPPRLLIATAVGGAVWLLAEGTASDLGRAVAILTALPFFFQGLAVIHNVSKGRAARPFMLVTVYFLILFVLGWRGLALVTGLGIAEQWAGLRWRFASPPGDEEKD